MKITNEIVQHKATSLGFNLVGFSNAELLTEEIDNLASWLDKDFHSGMSYMERNLEKRRDVSLILEGAKSLISLGMNYSTEVEYSNSPEFGKVSRYAWGKDYHLVMWEKLDQLITELKEIDPKLEAKSYVDTGPVMDKVWAKRGGLGWIGKHSNIINRQIGSWFFIATIITNYEFEPSPIVTDHCGSCTACIDACPTEAISEPYVVDANNCISYLTIENKGEIPNEFKDKFEGWIFGCDICQDVCPWNIKFSTESMVEEFRSTENKEIELTTVNELTNSQFKKKYLSSPILRTRLKGLKRNAELLLKS